VDDEHEATSELGRDRATGQSTGGLDTTRAVLLAIAFVVVLLIALVPLSKHDGAPPSGDGGTTTPTAGGSGHSTTTTSPAEKKQHQKAAEAAVNKSDVQVQVANGTSTAGIATTLTSKLMEMGWGTLPPVNASSTVPSSAIYYAAGKKPAGLLLASELHLPSSAVQPLTTSVPVPGANGDDLVLLVGPDLAS
jgi:hypothetical protein